MNTFLGLFNTILVGEKDQSHKAAREVRKLLYSSQNGGKYKDIAQTIEKAPEEYGKILEDWRQENFVIAVSVLYFLHNKESRPDFLFSWLFHLIQDPNGNIRHAATRMLRHELGTLTYHIRFPREKSSYFNKLSPEQADLILFGMHLNLMNLIEHLWKPVYKKYKYISLLPSGPYKSVQMVLGHMIEYCGEEYMAKLDKLYKTNK